MKKFCSVFFLLLFCFALSGCSFAATRTKPNAVNNPPQTVEDKINNPGVAENKAEIASSKHNKIINVVAKATATPENILAGKTLYDLAMEFEKSASSSTPEEENVILQNTIKELSFMKDCRRGTLLEDENVVSEVISETSLYYCAANRNSFAKNIEIALAVRTYQDCLAKNFSKVKTLGGQYHFYKTYSLSFAANFAIDSVLLAEQEKHPDWCGGRLAGTEKDYCLKLNKTSIENELLSYYRITDMPKAFAESVLLYKDLGYSKIPLAIPDDSEKFVADKMAAVGKVIEEKSKYRQCVSTSTDDEMSLPGGTIEGVDDLILGAEGRIKEEILGKTSEMISILSFSKREISDKVSGSQYINFPSTILALAHPEKGIRFSPSPIIDLKNDIVLKSEDFEPIVKDKPLSYDWGKNGEGKNIKMGLNDFLIKVIYDKDYEHASSTSYNKFTGKIKVDYQEAYPKSRFIEYSFPSQNGLREHDLWLFFEVYDNEWCLVGVVRS